MPIHHPKTKDLAEQKPDIDAIVCKYIVGGKTASDAAEEVKRLYGTKVKPGEVKKRYAEMEAGFKTRMMKGLLSELKRLLEKAPKS